MKTKIEPCYRRLGAAIREARLEAGITQGQLAKKMKISRPALANIEAQRQRVMLHEIFKFEEFFRVRNLFINKARGRKTG